MAHPIEWEDAPKSVLLRGLAVLEAFEQGDSSLSLSELARRTHLPTSTVHRLIGILVEWDTLERTSDGRYELGIRLFELGQLVPRQSHLREAAMPFIEDLYKATREVVHLGVLDSGEVLCVEKIRGRRGVRAPSRVGGRMPAHSTALGKCLLAYSTRETVETVIRAGLHPRTPYTIVVPDLLVRELSIAAERGVAFDREETSLGVTCAAAAVLDAQKRPVAALSVSGPTVRFDPERAAAAVRTAALGLSRHLSGMRIVA